jgi:protoheme IX farnesyltransferase
MIAAYYRLAKPGIVYSNTLTALAAYAFAAGSAAKLDTAIFLALGLAFSVGGAAAINNVIDRDIDRKMERTRMRAVPSGRIAPGHALAFGAALEIAGLALLFLHVSAFACAITLFGIIAYLALYTPSKRFTVHSTLIGSLSGAVPPVVGYVAGSGQIDLTAVLLWAVLTAWQMAHFFAIGLYRKDDYGAAGLPIMPVLLPAHSVMHRIVFYSGLFFASVLAIAFVNGLGLLYILPAGLTSLGWFAFSLSGYRASDTRSWALRFFFLSLIALAAWCLALALA